MTNEQIAEMQRELQTVIAQFESLSGRHIPDSIDQAAKELWEFAEDNDLAGRVAYFQDDQRADRKRLIRFGEARQMISEMEELLIDEMVKDEGDLVVARLTSIFNAFRWLASNWDDLPGLVGRIWDTVETAWEWLTQGVPALLRNVILTMALPAFYKVAKKAFIIRDRFPSRLREKALPQRNGSRDYRRKVSRL